MKFSGFKTERLVPFTGICLTAILLLTIWVDRFPPMQDYPQHLFYAKVAATYEDPNLNWKENYEIRPGFGPYRATFAFQSMLGKRIGVEMAGKMLLSLYVLLIALMSWLVCQGKPPDKHHHGALLCFPLCFHAMYFFGFLNYVISLPIIVLALVHLNRLQLGIRSPLEISGHLLLVVILFLLHPYSLLVYSTLAAVMAVFCWRRRRSFLLALYGCLIGSGLFLAWSFRESVVFSDLQVVSLNSLQMKWLPFSSQLDFMLMQFTGMNISSQPNWFTVLLWVFVAIVTLLAFIKRGKQYDSRAVFLVLAFVAALGLFILPFSVVMDSRYTYFNLRLAPLALFLLVPFLASVSFGRVSGLIVAVCAFLLTMQSAFLHHRVATEIETVVKIFDPMRANASVLPLIRGAPSQVLDPFFYANFQYGLLFYYHVTKGGGVNPDLFSTGLMPVTYKEGKRPGRPPHRDFRNWRRYAEDYDYVIARNVPAQVQYELTKYGRVLSTSGPWSLVELNKKHSSRRPR